jgi:putative serine protease PepD
MGKIRQVDVDKETSTMKLSSGIVSLALIGAVAIAGYAQACPGSTKATKASNTSSCGGKETVVATGGASCGSKTGAMGAGGSCCAKGAKSAQAGSCDAKGTMTCNMSATECEKMLRTYYENHGWLGIESNWCPGMAAQPTVAKVATGSPAEMAGFKAGDVLTAVNGINYSPENEATIQSLRERGFKVGDTVRYAALRDGKIVSLEARLVRINDASLREVVAAHVAASHTSSQDKAEKSM